MYKSPCLSSLFRNCMQKAVHRNWDVGLKKTRTILLRAGFIKIMQTPLKQGNITYEVDKMGFLNIATGI